MTYNYGENSELDRLRADTNLTKVCKGSVKRRLTKTTPRRVLNRLGRLTR